MPASPRVLISRRILPGVVGGGKGGFAGRCGADEIATIAWQVMYARRATERRA
jgi:hypothetical protein